MTTAALLLLADGRFPSGAHAHSFGVEAACAAGDIRTVDDLESFVHGRIATVGRVEAAFAAAVCAGLHDRAHPDLVPWREFDTELAARTASPVLRAASRSLGRQLLRAAGQVWPSPAYTPLRVAVPSGPFQPIVLGAVAHAAGLAPVDAALCSLHHLVTGLTTAAVRLLGLDPFTVAACMARTTGHTSDVAAEAATNAPGPIHELPATVGLLADVMAEHHATWEVRLFAS